jgi:hypothetical protein
MPWAGIVAVTAALFLIAIAIRLITPRRAHQADADWFRRFDPQRYQPMLRILDPAEFQFLQRQPGITRDLLRTLRRRRLTALCGYLASIRADFDRLQALGQVLIGSGRADRALADALFYSRLTFVRLYWSLRLHIVLYRMGLAPVDASGLLRAIGALDSAIRRPASAAATA